MPNNLPYYTYMLFVENCVVAALKVFTIVPICLLLYTWKFHPNKLRVSRISISMLAYLGTHLICSIFTLP
jgi:hypothetical protein